MCPDDSEHGDGASDSVGSRESDTESDDGDEQVTTTGSDWRHPFSAWDQPEPSSVGSRDNSVSESSETGWDDPAGEVSTQETSTQKGGQESDAPEDAPTGSTDPLTDAQDGLRPRSDSKWSSLGQLSDYTDSAWHRLDRPKRHRIVVTDNFDARLADLKRRLDSLGNLWTRPPSSNSGAGSAAETSVVSRRAAMAAASTVIASAVTRSVFASDEWAESTVVFGYGGGQLETVTVNVVVVPDGPQGYGEYGYGGVQKREL